METTLPQKRSTTDHGVAFVDHEGRYVHASLAYAETFGFEPNDLVGRPWTFLLSDDSRPAAALAQQRMTEAGEARIHARGLRSNGVALDVVIEVVRAGGSLGIAAGHYVVLAPPSPSRQSMRQSEPWFRSIVASCPDWFWACDPDGVLTYSNPALASILGRSIDDFLGRHWKEFVHPDDIAMLAEEMSASVHRDASAPILVRWRHADGSYRTLEGTLAPVFGPDGGHVGFMGIDREASGAWRDGAASQRASVGDAWLDWWIQGEDAAAPPEVLVLHATDPARYSGRLGGLLAALHPDDRADFEEARRRALGDHEPFSRTYRVVTAEGTRIVQTEGEAIAGDGDPHPTMLFRSRDITAQVEAERERTRSQHREFHERFVSHVSHELRSPVTAIYQFVTILLDRLAGELTAEQEEYLAIVLRNVQQLRNMITDLLEVARSQTGKLTVSPRRVVLSEIVDQALRSMQAAALGKSVGMHVPASEPVPDLLADPVRLHQVLVNLIDNAIKFTPSGGTITLQTGRDREHPECVRISVTDTGCGISVIDAAHVFEQLYQVDKSADFSRKGLGLGLFICRDLVQRQGGDIWVESSLGRGSTFHFTVPILSLAPLLPRLLTPRTLAGGWLAVVTAHVQPLEMRALGDSDEAAMTAVWEVLDRCYLPDRDLLLPRSCRSDHGETFTIVAGADRGGAQLLAQRVRNQLSACEALTEARLRASVESEMIPIPPASSPPNPRLVAEELSAAVTAVTQRVQHQEVIHGPTPSSHH